MIARRLTPLAVLLLAGCSLAPTYERPASPIPPSWPAGDAYLRQSEAELPVVSYRDIFRDARLQQLIEQALANNRDLRIAAANIAVARAQYRIQRADLFPAITAGASANVGDSGQGVRESYSVDVGTTAFEVDLFGRIRNLSRAALEEYFGTEAAARATRLALVGDIADAWLTYAADRSLLKIAEETARSAAESVRLTRLRLEGGIVPRSDLRQAELIEAQAKSDLAQLRTALAQDVNLMRLLVGAEVDPALLPDSIEAAAPTLAELPAGLDSSVLLRRPDVMQAEYGLRAANARIGAARAALFPRISLTGLVGFASNALGSLFSGGAFNWTVAPGATQTIFDFGATRGSIAQSEAQRDRQLATYERTIQTAFREVADALARRGTIADQQAAQEQLVASAGDNYRLANARYRGGIETFLQSLDAQRSFYNAQRSLVSVRLTRAQNLVDLYRTLGGDTLAQPDLVTPSGAAGEP